LLEKRQVPYRHHVGRSSQSPQVPSKARPSLDARLVFAANLRRLRKAANLSQEALAYQARIDRTYVSSCERGKRNIAVVNIFKLAATLAVDPRGFLAPVEPVPVNAAAPRAARGRSRR
jgi:DNA-binding XRE family transcriptional regulator